jgi:hypothetical protein
MLFLCLIWVFYSIAVPHGREISSMVADASLPSPDSPSTRSLWSLIWSCLTIIISCTWTVVNPNVPDPKDNDWVIRFRKMKLCLLAIVAPECMAMWAIRQHLHAKKLRDMYNESCGYTGEQKITTVSVSTDTPLDSKMDTYPRILHGNGRFCSEATGMQSLSNCFWR